MRVRGNLVATYLLDLLTLDAPTSLKHDLVWPCSLAYSGAIHIPYLAGCGIHTHWTDRAFLLDVVAPF